jgi:hypothetical protein
MITILSHRKTFNDPWIGSKYLNRHGLHRWRMSKAQACAEVRKTLSRPYPPLASHAVEQIETQGFAVIHDFLQDADFAALAAEVEGAFAAVERQQPIVENVVPGFGARHKFQGGFDRYDGGTLNRFLSIKAKQHPAAAGFARDPRLGPLTNAVCGRPHYAWETRLYLTVNGQETSNADIQKVLHRDTFFSSMKFWYFLHPVTVDDGPFTYVPGSHVLSKQRLAWEQAMANEVVQRDPIADEDQAGSFRIDEQQLASLGYGPPTAVTCPANTLVIANTLGFHRRGDATPGTRRLAIYGWHRPFPFGLLGF